MLAFRYKQQQQQQQRFQICTRRQEGASKSGALGGVAVVVVYTETLARVIRPTDSTHQPGKPIVSGRYHRQFFGVRQVRGSGIREQSPDSRSSLAILPMYDPEVAGLVDRSRQGSVHCRGGDDSESTTGPCICEPFPGARSLPKRDSIKTGKLVKTSPPLGSQPRTR